MLWRVPGTVFDSAEVLDRKILGLFRGC